MAPVDGANEGARRGRNILLTGRPGIGKTTVMMRLIELARGRSPAGFYTEEIRQDRGRQGFRAVTLSGKTAMLAHVRVKGKPRVGRYGVHVAAFEILVMPELAKPADVVLIDEIGRMECCSSRFIEVVRLLLDGPASVVATVAIKGGGFIAEVKARSDVEIRQVTQANRDELAQELAACLPQSEPPASGDVDA
ncbi:MAG TPA: nucleoside-triphosphatase [Phycisphaerae bacterium]|nr:nucleoside-triphosphatase [Phycisphaerae bacterium]